ncbi:MAG: LamG-like jellyroll fold domain-containing protein, partial [Bacteroidota bacterium]
MTAKSLTAQPCNGYALEFDGTQKYVEFADDTVISSIGGNFTFQAWMKIDKYPTAMTAVWGKWGQGSTDDDEWACNLFPDGRIELDVSGKASWDRLFSTQLPLNQWIHITQVLDSAKKKHLLYINGILNQSNDFDFPMDRDTREAFRFGTYNFNYLYFDGVLDDIRIWKLALTKAQIDSTMHCNLTGNEPELILYLPMDEGKGDTVKDRTTRALTGVLNNKPVWIQSDLTGDKPHPKIKGDTLICEGEIKNLDAGRGYLTYKWSTGDTLQTIQIDKPGIYTVRVESACHCFGESSITVKKNPLASGFILDAGPDSTLLKFTNVHFGELVCKDIKIINSTNSIVMLDDVTVLNNIYFSLPLSYFPIIFGAKQEKYFKVCFNAKSFGTKRDTLKIQDLCGSRYVFLEGTCSSNMYSGSTKCGVNIIGQSDSLAQIINEF